MSAISTSSQSAPLSDTDAHILFLYGRDLTQDAVGLIWETVFISAYGIFFGVAVYSIIRKGFRSRSSIPMLCVITYLYASSLTLWSLTLTLWFKNANSLFLDRPNIALPDRKNLVINNVAKFNTPVEALYLFNMVIGDTIVIWRAWVICQRTLWVIWLPCIMLLLSFIFSIINITCLSTAGTSDDPVCTNFDARLVSWAFSFVTNATCTILIGYKAWQHRRSMKSLNIVGKMSTDKVLSILVESGFIYCLFWLTQLILFFNIDHNTPVAYLWELFARMGDQISGMYPTLIIVIVNFKQTIWETSPITNSVSMLRFAGSTGSTGLQDGIRVDVEIESTGGMGRFSVKAPASEDVYH